VNGNQSRLTISPRLIMLCRNRSYILFAVLCGWQTIPIWSSLWSKPGNISHRWKVCTIDGWCDDRAPVASIQLGHLMKRPRPIYTRRLTATELTSVHNRRHATIADDYTDVCDGTKNEFGRPGGGHAIRRPALHWPAISHAIPQLDRFYSRPGAGVCGRCQWRDYDERWVYDCDWMSAALLLLLLTMTRRRRRWYDEQHVTVACKLKTCRLTRLFSIRTWRRH